MAGDDRVGELERRIAELEAEAKERERAISETRHDLLSPLNAIIGFSSLLIEKTAGTLPERDRGNLRRIHDNGRALLEMLRKFGKAPGADPASPEPSEDPVAAPAAARTPPRGRGGKVLVVDDVESNRELLRQELSERGFEVLTAAGGPQAIELARTWMPGVIITDIQMPGMDGLEVCRRLKADMLTSHIPVLFLTGQRADEETGVEALAAGGNDFLQKPYAPSILLARVNSQMAIHDAQARLRQMVMTDELTGVYSRRFLFESMRKQLQRLTRPGPPAVSALMCDVDHFKKVNDTLGHLEGDLVLKRVAEILRTTVRGSDLVARFGGEEFVVVLPGTKLDAAVEVGEKIRAAIEAGTKSQTPVTISIGAACHLHDPGDWSIRTSEQMEADLDALFRKADEALYEAKAGGRNRVVAAG